MTTYTATIPGPDGSTLTIAAQHVPAPAPQPPRMLLGIDCTDADLDQTNAQYPRNAYHRIFPGRTGLLPDLANRNGKLYRLPPHTVRHVSFDRYDPATLDQWLTTVTDLAPAEWKIWLSLGHEVDRPDKGTDPAAYRRDLTAVVAACADHPVVQRVSVILTGYYLDEKRGDPKLYLVDGAELDADRYNMRDQIYRTPQALFDPLLDAVLATGRDQTAIPEFGGERITADTNGQARAQWLRDCYHHLHANDDLVRAVGWWNIGGCELLVGLHVPELATMQTLIDRQ